MFKFLPKILLVQASRANQGAILPGLLSSVHAFRNSWSDFQEKNVKNLSLLIFLILHAVIMKTFMGHYIVEPRAIHLICVMRGRFHIFCAAASETDAACHTRLHNLVGMWISKRLFGFYIRRPITISGLWTLDRDWSPDARPFHDRSSLASQRRLGLCSRDPHWDHLRPVLAKCLC